MDEKVFSLASRVYCTLFDSYYLSRGLLMIESLLTLCQPEDKIYVFCFDDLSFKVLSDLKSSQIIPISLAELETPALLNVKASRTKGEYCWTCTPHVLKHVLVKYGEKECTYIDADLYFYQNPGLIVPSSSDDLVLITEHRYTPKYDQSSTSGRFCVQFLTFKNETRSMALLDRWASQCIDWCFARHEAGKFGDQMYLDEWPNFGNWVKISDDSKVGVAPWNIQQYSEADSLPVFYHFHALKWYADGRFDLGGYEISSWVKKRLYTPYIIKLYQKSMELNEQYAAPLPCVMVPTGMGLHSIKYRLKALLRPNKLIHISNIS